MPEGKCQEEVEEHCKGVIWSPASAKPKREQEEAEPRIKTIRTAKTIDPPNQRHALWAGQAAACACKVPNKHGFRNYPRFRNYGSETISSDSETTWSGSETAVQQLFSRIQKLFRTDSETVCSDSGNSRDSETTVQKLFRAIQKLFRAIQELFSTDSETIPRDSETILRR